MTNCNPPVLQCLSCLTYMDLGPGTWFSPESYIKHVGDLSKVIALCVIGPEQLVNKMDQDNCWNQYNVKLFPKLSIPKLRNYTVFWFIYLIFCLFWDRVSCSLDQPQTHLMAEDDIELLILLPQLTDLWGDRHELSCPLCEGMEIEPSLLCMLGKQSVAWLTSSHI